MNAFSERAAGFERLDLATQFDLLLLGGCSGDWDPEFYERYGVAKPLDRAAPGRVLGIHAPQLIGTGLASVCRTSPD